MSKPRLLLAMMLVICSSQFTLGQMSAPAPAKTPGEALAGTLGIVEHEFMSAADAMPEDKFSFAPTAGEFKGVRTFAQQVKHVAAANYFFGSVVLGQKPPVELGGENGPDSLKSKSEIMKFLHESFAYLRQALASVSDKNEFEQIDSPMGMKVPRLGLASFSLAHPMDHYGQMVEYLRMNGIVPPATRSRNP